MMGLNGTEFMGAGIVYIRNVSGNNMQAFVSKLSRNSGNDSWYVVPAAFEGDKWDRTDHGWEVIAFKNDREERVGFYINLEGVTTYATFHSFSNVEINQVKKT